MFHTKVLKGLITGVIAFLFIGTPVLSKQNQPADLPIFNADDLNLDTSKLRPHRLLYSPRDGVGGYEDGLFADGIYIDPQVSITMDRTVYYDAKNSARDAIRVRWVANTHPHTDEIVVDAATLSTLNEQTRTGRNWETKNKFLHVRNGVANVSSVTDGENPSRTTFPLEHNNHYGLMILPYLFAAMDVPPGAHFKLPAIGSDQEGFIEIQAQGEATFTNAKNQKVSAQLYTSVHSWGSIDWYIDVENPPYHQQAIWYFGERGTPGSSAVSKVIDWIEFKVDAYENVINRELLRDSP